MKHAITTIITAILGLVGANAGNAEDVGLYYPGTLLPSINIRINPVDGATGVPSDTFGIKNQLADTVSVTKVGVYVDSTAQGPSTISIYDGATAIGTQAIPANSAGNVFPVNVTFSLQGSAEKILTVKANYPSNAQTGTKVTLMVSGVEYVKSDTTVNTTSAQIWGPEIHLFQAVANFALVSDPQGSKTNVTVGGTTTSSLMGVFNLNLSALGGNIAQLDASDVQVVALPTNDHTHAYVCQSVSVITIPNTSTADGSVSSVTIVGVIPVTMLPQSGGYRLAISRISWTSSLGQRVNQTWGFENMYTGVVVAIKPNTKFGTVSTTTTSDTLSLVADIVNDLFTVQACGNLGQGQWINVPIDAYQVAAISKDQVTNGAQVKIDVPRSYLATLLGTSEKVFIRVSQ